jgi:hypothetical protein
MPYTEYPSGEDVKGLLDEAGIDGCHLDLESSALEAVAIWEGETRYKPFLQGESISIFYDPPGPNFRHEAKGGEKILLLDRGFTTITAVATGITPDDPVGDVLAAGAEYRLLPYNAVVDKRPYTSIEFVRVQWGGSRSIKVTGTPGYSSEIPADAYRAILKLAGSEALRTLKEGIAQGPVEWAEGDVRERSSIELLSKLGNTWSMEARRTMRRYLRF